MTEETDNDAWRLAAFVPAETDQERQEHDRHAMRRLTIAQDAMKLALWAADRASHTARSRLTSAEIFADWLAANQMVQVVFRHLSFEVSNAIETIRQRQSSR